MPHSRNRPHHPNSQQQHHAPSDRSRKEKKGNAAMIFAVFVGLIGLVIGYITVGSAWQLYAIIIFASLVGFFIGKKVDDSVFKKK